MTREAAGQLPATLTSGPARAAGHARSLMERLMTLAGADGAALLDTQCAARRARTARAPGGWGPPLYQRPFLIRPYNGSEAGLLSLARRARGSRQIPHAP